MINNVVLVGRLTKDLDLRYTSNGTAVATFSMAVNRQFTNQEGKRDADFINCVIWRKSAESMANFTRKGSLVGIEGHIQTRSYDNQQGQKVYVTEVVVEEVTFLESKKTGAQSNGDYQQTNTQQYNSNQSSNQNSNQYSNNDPFDKSGTPVDIEDDDLPF